jgi:hypothetical protein
VRILFIGNSFTARNNLSALLARLANERGRIVEHRLISAGGASLRQHLNNAPEAQQAITTAYATIAAEVGATLVPVGMVWERFLSAHDSPFLHDADDSHPALAGSYLAACVFLISLLGEHPVDIDIPVKGLDADTATLLRQSAWDICEDIASGR